MGFFSKWKQSSQKSKLMKAAATQVQSGQLKQAVAHIYSFYQTDQEFQNILLHFEASPTDIENIIKGIMAAGAGGTIKGHYVPVSAVLFHDTLAYMLRTQREQVPKAQAYFEIQDYFQSGAIVFQPEREFH